MFFEDGVVRVDDFGGTMVVGVDADVEHAGDGGAADFEAGAELFEGLVDDGDFGDVAGGRLVVLGKGPGIGGRGLGCAFGAVAGAWLGGIV